MGSPNDIKKGAVIIKDGEPWVVTSFQHVNPGKGAAFVRTRIKNAKTGKTLEQTYKTSETMTFAEIEYRNMAYLYHDNTGYVFMDNKNYEQVSFSDEDMGEDAKYMKEGLDVIICMYEGLPIAVQVPKKMKFTIVETAPAVKGDTASGNVTKEAKTDTGFSVQVPIFLNQGDDVIVNTETGEYVERAK
ncbi:MAG: elongation factor P [Patescibacteria group bacterium]|nr:elongation factor P [Patescibacteria group bacterium]